MATTNDTTKKPAEKKTEAAPAPAPKQVIKPIDLGFGGVETSKPETAPAPSSPAAPQYNNYEDVYNELISTRKNQVKQAEAEAETKKVSDYNTRVFGGLTEAAASISNLIGTMAGSTSQQWQTPQAQWASQSDAYRREREAKIEGYRGQLATLQQQKAAIREDRLKRAENAALQQQKTAQQIALTKYKQDRADARTAGKSNNASSKDQIAFAKAYNTAYNKLYNASGRKPSDEEVMAAMGGVTKGSLFDGIENTK